MTDKPHTVAWYQYQQALAAKFAKVMADCRREDEREDAARTVAEDWRKNDREWEGITAQIDGGIHERGSPRWIEVRDEETGPDED